MNVCAVLIAVAVGILVLRAVLWLWDTYELGRAVQRDSDRNQ